MKYWPLFLLLIVAACTKPERAQEESRWRASNGRIKVLTTTAMIHDVVTQVGGSEVDSIPLIRGELDPHSYELVKGDDEKFSRADVIFYNGLGLEHSLSMRRKLEGNRKAVAVANHLLEKDTSLILIVDGQYDPHVWTDLSLWASVIEPIVEALSHLEPSKAALFEKRGEAFRKRMLALDRFAFQRLQSIEQERRYLVTSHDAFNYFTRRYLRAPGELDWKRRFRAPEGLAPEAQLSIADIKAVVDHISECGVTVLFPESNVSRDSLKKILSAVGPNVRLCERPLYGDAMEEGQSYLEMMEHNISVIARELDERKGS
ncbi:MAG: Periplasmic zinc-binding protein TroA [Chlamydiales bacterium]|nr:Periplasmic zinc-binding protein TroA [Chlamydiales bacterium]MCH9635530.1 Periplasmic zinc-binding protein TroA [Chlamydiales bacterium]MCH9703739.1 zinc ABC transporter substrate-binding protein [Chlamydiota bacterium]